MPTPASPPPAPAPRAARGHKTLVFSQSKRMLQLLEAEVQRLGAKYCMLTGDITDLADRGRTVERFQSDECVEGGVGVRVGLWVGGGADRGVGRLRVRVPRTPPVTSSPARPH